MFIAVPNGKSELLNVGTCANVINVAVCYMAIGLGVRSVVFANVAYSMSSVVIVGVGLCPIVTGSRSFVSGVVVTADRTGVRGVTTVYAVGIGYYCIVVMAECSLFNVGCVIASGTSYICIPTLFGTSGSLSIVRNFIVSNRIYVRVNVGVFAMTDVCGIALLQAGGRRDNRRVVVPLGRDLFISRIIAS